MGVFSACSKLVLVLAIAGGCAFYVTPDILKGVSSDMTLQQWQIHAALVGFCLSPVPDMLSKKNRVEDMERDSKIDDAGQGFEYERTEERMDGKTTGGEFDFEKDGDIGAQLASIGHTQNTPPFSRKMLSPRTARRARQLARPDSSPRCAAAGAAATAAVQRTTTTTRPRSTRSCTGCTRTPGR